MQRGAEMADGNNKPLSSPRFGLLSLFAFLSLVAIGIAAIANPSVLVAVVFTYTTIRVSPLVAESRLTTCIHNGVIGFTVGLLASVLLLLVAINIEDESYSRFALGLTSLPVAGMLFGIIYGIWCRGDG